jgi:hypothetical protein
VNSAQLRLSKVKRLKEKAENVDEYVHSYAFALTDHDAAHQEHFRQQALGWCRRLLKELESSA